MSRTDRWILVFLTTLALVVGACAQSSEPETTSDEGPAHIEDIAGSEVKRVTLTDEAADRIGVQTVPVAAADGGRVKVPSATVLFDQQGRTWVFTEPEHDVFVREPVTVIGTNGEGHDPVHGSGRRYACRDRRCAGAVRHRARRRRPGVSGQVGG